MERAMKTTSPYRGVLILWDIDHTLLDITVARYKFYEQTFWRTTGMQLHRLASLPGGTTVTRIVNTLLMNDVEPTESLVRSFCSELSQMYVQSAEELVLGGTVLPGVRAALRQFSSMLGVHQSILTGNVRDIAEVKIKAFGLAPPLDTSVGAFGDDSAERHLLLAVARHRYGVSTGNSVPMNRIVLIGDTVHDMRAARAAGARGVAVATGKFSPCELLKAGADLALESLTDVRRLVDLVEDVLMSGKSDRRIPSH
jgi:phosphoglycolate phosphatase